MKYVFFCVQVNNTVRIKLCSPLKWFPDVCKEDEFLIVIRNPIYHWVWNEDLWRVDAIMKHHARYPPRKQCFYGINDSYKCILNRLGKQNKTE